MAQANFYVVFLHTYLMIMKIKQQRQEKKTEIILKQSIEYVSTERCLISLQKQTE